MVTGFLVLVATFGVDVSFWNGSQTLTTINPTTGKKVNEYAAIWTGKATWTRSVHAHGDRVVDGWIQPGDELELFKYSRSKRYGLFRVNGRLSGWAKVTQTYGVSQSTYQYTQPRSYNNTQRGLFRGSCIIFR